MDIKNMLKKIKERELRVFKRKPKIKVTYTRPAVDSKKPLKAKPINRRILFLRYIGLGLVVAFTIGFSIHSFNVRKDVREKEQERERLEAMKRLEAAREKDTAPQEEEPEEKELPIIDLSEHCVALETDLQRINEPIPYNREVLYSAGNSENIDEPVFQNLYLLNLDTGEEKSIAETEIKFGEIYEGRFNQDWIAWLDTNQSGENRLYVIDRKTQKKSRIKTCEFNKPQLRLAGDNLVWVEQKDVDQDRLYLYNFRSGEPVVLEAFNNPTYGTCPPSISDELLVWVAPSEEDPENASIIKVLDLSKALFVDQSISSQWDEEMEEEDVSESIDKANDDGDQSEVSDEAAETGDEGEAETSDEQEDKSNNSEEDESETLIESSHEALEEGVDPEIIDPKGFAIYPATYGKAIAWLDNLDPSNANLKLTLDNGKTIIDVAHGVARPYGIGDGFIAYMKDDCVMVYFWELERHAQLNKPGTKARLTQGGVQGNTVIWYSADNPNQKNDELFISTVNKPTQDQLMGSK